MATDFRKKGLCSLFISIITFSVLHQISILLFEMRAVLLRRSGSPALWGVLWTEVEPGQVGLSLPLGLKEDEVNPQ